MSPNLARISDKAKAQHTLVFTSLYHHIADIEHLRACYQLLKGNKAVGVDEVTKSMYARRSRGKPPGSVHPPQTHGLQASAQAQDLHSQAW